MTSLVPSPDNILEMLRDGRHFSDKREGNIHIVDSLTGESRYVFLATLPNAPTKWQEVTLPSGSICLVQEEINPTVIASRREVTYSPLVVDLLCSRMVESNKGITQICKDPDMPSYSALCAWRRSYPWIDDRINVARMDRAERYRDEAVQKADEAVDAKDVPVKALQVEIRKWAAGVDSPRYSPKAKMEATINMPTQVNILTGINKDPLPEVGDK